LAAVSRAPYDPTAMVPPYLQRSPSIWAGSFAAACALAGCGRAAAPSTPSTPESMAVDARLTELQQENQELRARLARATRDAKGPDACGERGERPQGDAPGATASGEPGEGEGAAATERPPLRVVRLVPPGTPAAPATHSVADEPVTASALPTSPDTQPADAPRPMLRLRGNEEPKLQPLDDAVTLAPTESSRTKP
jgi:hypothetical protein